jgi:hypothetical protein
MLMHTNIHPASRPITKTFVLVITMALNVDDSFLTSHRQQVLYPSWRRRQRKNMIIVTS